MEQLLEIFAGIEIPSSKTETFIRSILYNPNFLITKFVANYGLALENLSKSISSHVNLRFIRRRKQIIDVMRLEQARKQDDELVFHLKYHGKSETTQVLTVSGIRSTSNHKQEEMIITLDESSPNDKTVLSAILLDIIDKNTPFYLPVVYNDTKQKSELILQLSIDKPHI